MKFVVLYIKLVMMMHMFDIACACVVCDVDISFQPVVVGYSLDHTPSSASTFDSVETFTMIEALRGASGQATATQTASGLEAAGGGKDRDPIGGKWTNWNGHSEHLASEDIG